MDYQSGPEGAYWSQGLLTEKVILFIQSAPYQGFAIAPKAVCEPHRRKAIPTSMARPQKSPDDRASAAFRIRLTAADRELLGEKAAAAGVTLSALIRVAVLGYRLQPALVWGEVINELKRIGINLDQIARHVDATGGLRADLGEALAEVRQAISRILSMA